MVTLQRLLGLALFFYIINLSQGETLDNDIQKLQNKEDETREGLFDIFDCVNYTCTWCARWAGKMKVCNMVGILEKTKEGKTEFSVQYNITVNNNLVFSDIFNLSRVPPFCYSLAGVEGCLRLYLKKATNRTLEACTSLKVSMGNISLSEYQLHCIQIPSGNRPGRMAAGFEKLLKLFNYGVKDEERRLKDMGRLHFDTHPWVDGISANYIKQKLGSMGSNAGKSRNTYEYAEIVGLKRSDLRAPKHTQGFGMIHDDPIPWVDGVSEEDYLVGLAQEYEIIRRIVQKLLETLQEKKSILKVAQRDFSRSGEWNSYTGEKDILSHYPFPTSPPIAPSPVIPISP